jgi:hypothetical protein
MTSIYLYLAEAAGCESLYTIVSRIRKTEFFEYKWKDFIGILTQKETQAA